MRPQTKTVTLLAALRPCAFRCPAAGRGPNRRPPGGLSRLCPGLGRLDLAPLRRAHRPLEKVVRSQERLRLPGARRLPRDGRHLRLFLREGEKARIRRAGQEGPPHLRRLPLRSFPDWARKIRADYEDAVPPLPDFFTVMRYIRAYDTLHRLGRLSPAERPNGRDDHRREHHLSAPHPGMGGDEPGRPAGRDPGLGRPGPARPPGRRDLGDAAPRPGRRQLGPLGDRGRHDLSRRLALCPARLRRRPRQDGRALPDAGDVLLRPLLPQPHEPGRHDPRFRRRPLGGQLAPLPRLFRGRGRGLQGPRPALGGGDDRPQVSSISRIRRASASATCSSTASAGARTPSRRPARDRLPGSHGGRPGQEDRLPRRLDARLDLSPPQLPGRRRRRPRTSAIISATRSPSRRRR